MTAHQIEAFGLVAAMLALFMSGRLRFDVVAAVILLAAVLLGVVPGAKAFHGFANPVIIIIASVLVVSRAIAASSILELSVGALLSGVALAVAADRHPERSSRLPVGLHQERRHARHLHADRDPDRAPQRPPRSIYLMPLAFASLIGGTITKIGTSPNLLISSVRQELGQPPFGLFDFVAVGLPLTTIAIVFLAFGWRLLPHREGQQTRRGVVLDRRLLDRAARAGDADHRVTVGDFESLGEGDVSIAAILREGTRRYVPAEDWRLYPDDVLVVLGDPTVVHKLIAATGFEIVGSKELASPDEKSEEMQVVEVIVTADSPLVGATPRSLGLRHKYGLNLFAVRRAGSARPTRLRAHRFQAGDVVLFQGWEKNLAASVTELGLLPLADRKLSLGQARNGLVPIGCSWSPWCGRPAAGSTSRSPSSPPRC